MFQVIGLIVRTAAAETVDCGWNNDAMSTTIKIPSKPTRKYVAVPVFIN
jgi:hypothetical protein